MLRHERMSVLRLAAALSVLLLLAGCTVQQDAQLLALVEEAKAAAAASTAVLERPDVVRYTAQEKPVPGLACTDHFTPDALTGADGHLARLLYARLFVLAPDGRPEPSVCTGYVWEGTDFVMTLAPLTFADGAAMTAQDVVYSLARHGYTASVRESGCVVIACGVRDGGLPACLSRVPLLREGTGGEAFALCSGPYALTDDGTGVYERAEPARIRSLVRCGSRDELLLAARTAQVEYFELDIAGGEAIPGAEAYRAESKSTRRFHFLYFNAWNRGFTPVEGRLAVSAAIDREAMAGNGLVPAYTYVPADCYLADEALLSQAEAVLEDAGRTIRREVRLIVNAENAARIERCRVIAGQLAAIGLQVQVEVLAWEDYLDALEGWDFDLAYGEIELPESYALPELFVSDGALNFQTYRSVEADELMRAFIEADTDERPAAFARLCTRLSADCPIAPLFFEEVTAYRYAAP